MRRQLAVWCGCALALATLSGCASDTDQGQQRRELDKAGRRIVSTLNEIVPLIGHQLRTTLHGGTTGWSSCTVPVAGDAQAQADLQFDTLGVTRGDGLDRLSSALEDAGWRVRVNPRGSVTAARAGLQLQITFQGIVQSVSLHSACVKTSKDVDEEYDGRPTRHLPVPWPAGGID